MDDLEYGGLLPDGTLYGIKLSFKDEALYKKIVHALEKRRAENIMDGGLLKILLELGKISPEEEISYKN
ncbi:hypothetical protein FJZ53_02425 [Candidatus Woesearchaeota archaeon]|nr:hypothetical protein [Candidatus Woesearchaeota archaeon]